MAFYKTWSLVKPNYMSKKIFMVLVFLLTVAGLLSAQTRTVKGNVIFSEDGQPAIGAYVSVEGTKIGSITDVEATSRSQECLQAQNLLL